MLKRFLLSVFFLVFCLSGCTHSANDKTTIEPVRTFAPENKTTEEQEHPSGESRGILKRVFSPSGNKCAYIFTFDAKAESVEYSLAVSDKYEPFAYQESDALYTSKYLFDIEWGDDETLMVSLNEKDPVTPATCEFSGVKIMFGQVSSVQ